MKVDSEFCDTSSPTTKGNECGVAELLADAEADNIAPTANTAMTSMLADMIASRVSIDSELMPGKNCADTT